MRQRKLCTPIRGEWQGNLDDIVSLISALCRRRPEAGDVQVVDPVDDVAGEEAERERRPARLVHQLGRVRPPPPPRGTAAPA